MIKAWVEVIKPSGVADAGRIWKRNGLANEAGAVASEVARAAGIHTSHLVRWRRSPCERTQILAVFNSVPCTPGPEVALVSAFLQSCAPRAARPITTSLDAQRFSEELESIPNSSTANQASQLQLHLRHAFPGIFFCLAKWQSKTSYRCRL